MLNEHEDRRAIVEEMHLRRWPLLQAPCTVLQFVRLVDPAEREAERAAFEPPHVFRPDTGSGSRHLAGEVVAGVPFVWERHSEASTLSLFFAGNEPSADAYAWAAGLPGKVVRATRILIERDEASVLPLVDAQQFDPMHLVSCNVGQGEGAASARIWSDFRLGDDGFGLVIIAANGLAASDLSRAVQRLQELGNYRNLALLGLPVARRGWAALDRIEERLIAIANQLPRDDVSDDHLLDEVTSLSIELASTAARDDYRMSATEAYVALVEERLNDLQVTPVAGFSSLGDFTQRRLMPAVRTCAAHRRRTEQLAQRTAQFVSLFRTRIETRIEDQNAQVLASMEANTVRQLQMQQLVEGFSVVALTYYAVSLLGHLLDAAPALDLHIDHDLAVLAATPLVAVTIWLLVHRAKARVLSD